MKELKNKIFTNALNAPVLEFLEIDPLGPNRLLSYSEAVEENNFWEGDYAYLQMNLPTKYKFLFVNHAMFIDPETGEIFAFHYGMWDSALKICFRDRLFNRTLKRLKRTFRTEKQTLNYDKLSLNYFSNIYGDYVVDTRILGKEWAIGLYFTGQIEEKIRRYIKAKIE